MRSIDIDRLFVTGALLLAGTLVAGLVYICYYDFTQKRICYENGFSKYEAGYCMKRENNTDVVVSIKILE